MRVLVTGAAGRIGRAICSHLSRDHQVLGLDVMPASTVDLVGDIADPRLVRYAVRQADAIVHTAALHAPHVGAHADTEFERVNVRATVQLARMAVDAGIRRFVFTSTTALYGAASRSGSRAVWVDEALTPQPATVYHRTKLAAESALADIARQHGLCVTALRMSRCFPEPAQQMAAYRLHRGVDARDVAEAHALALQRDTPGTRTYIISAETPFSDDDLVDLLHDAPAVLRRRVPALVEAFARRRWQLPLSIDRIYSAAGARAAMGWRSRYGFEDVLRLCDAGSTEVLPATGNIAMP